MNCTKHFLMFRWEQHNWRPGVSWADAYSSRGTNMWGRVVTQRYVVCQPQYRCSECGKERVGSCCTCDQERAVRCPRRGQDRVTT